MKHVARNERESGYKKASEWLNAFYEKGRKDDVITDDERKKALKYIKEGTAVDDRIIQYVVDFLDEIGVDYMCAPYQADGQLVRLEKDGVIHGSLTADSDFTHVGAKAIYFDVDFNRKQWRIYRQADVINGSYPLSMVVRFALTCWLCCLFFDCCNVRRVRSNLKQLCLSHQHWYKHSDN